MTEADNSYKYYLKELLVLALPLFIGNIGHTLIGAGDVLVISKYNINSLAAVSIANSILFTIMIFGLGVLAAVSIVLSNYRGAKQHIKKHLISVLVLSLVLSFVFSALCYLSKYIVPFFGLEISLIPDIQEYISIAAFSMTGVFLYEGIKQFLQAYEIVKFPNFLSIFSVILNLAVNVIFVFGFWIIPEMGTKGAAFATLFVRFFAGLAMFIYVYRFINFKEKINSDVIKNILKTGIPIGFALLFELLAFNIVTVLAGKENSMYAAVHSILITIANASFMLPLALSTALSVKVSYWFGAMKPLEVKKYSYTAITAVLFIMIFIGVIMAVFPREIISIFTSDEAALNTAVPIIYIAAAYQIFDGLQCVTGGILKGFKLTKTVSAIVLGSYWIIGAPIAYITVSKFGMSLRGYWIALALALFSMGFIQTIAAKYYYKKLLKTRA